MSGQKGNKPDRPSRPDADTDSQATPIGGVVVLHVEDDEGDALLVRRQLERGEYTVVHAPDGPAAIQLFGSSLPDVVLLDLKLPGIDGFGTCEAMRRLDSGEDVPICALTGAEITHDMQERVMAAGFDDILSKQAYRTELLVRVRALARHRRLIRQAQAQAQLMRVQRDKLAAATSHRDSVTKKLDLLLAPLERIVAAIDDQAKAPLPMSRWTIAVIASLAAMLVITISVAIPFYFQWRTMQAITHLAERVDRLAPAP